jgi:hypothetical protein
MAISYEALLPQILPMVSGCPDTLVENSIRSSVIELCEKASVYQAELDPVTTVANIHEYDLEPPSGTTIQKVLWVTHLGKDLEPITTSLLEQRLPNWRDSANFTVPKYFIKQTSAVFWLVPTPAATAVSSTIIRAVLKPTHSSTSCDDDVMNDYRDTIVNGALFRLLRIPNKDWTDFNGASVYGSLFNQAVVEAERRARQGDTGVARKVNYAGTSSGAWRTRRNRYGREFG